VRVRWYFVIVHAVIVSGLTALFVFRLLTYDGIGADIGLGMIGMPILLLGLPWTIPYLKDPYAFDSLPDAIHFVVTLGPAFVNVGIFAASVGVVRWLRDRPGARTKRDSLPF